MTTWQQGQNALLHELLQTYGDRVSFAELPESELSKRTWLRIFLELQAILRSLIKPLMSFVVKFGKAPPVGWI